MASYRFHFRPSIKPGRHEGKLFIRIIHRRKAKTFSTPYSLFPEEWSEKDGKVIMPEEGSQRRRHVENISHAIEVDSRNIELKLSKLSLRKDYDIRDIAKVFNTLGRETLQSYTQLCAEKLGKSGKNRTARAYLSSVASLENFTGHPVFPEEINARLIKRYESHLIAQGLKLNTISFYMRNLRAVYNRAVREKVIPAQADNPFAEVCTGVYETPKRSLDKNELNRFAMLEGVLAAEKDARRNTIYKPEKLQDALYYFLFCYHCRGMSFVDMAFLKKSDINGDRLRYRRRKTGGWLEVKVTPPMEKIIDHFSGRTAGSEYVFPIIDPRKGNERRQYETGLSNQNRTLGYLSRMAGIEKKVTTHVSRHTWATMAKRSKADIPVISEALGHRDVTTTRRYLASFEQSTIDRLSDMMSDMIGAKIV